MRCEVGEQVDKAVRLALPETVFRLELVMRIIVTAHEMVEKEILLDAALVGQLGMLVSEDQ